MPLDESRGPSDVSALSEMAELLFGAPDVASLRYHAARELQRLLGVRAAVMGIRDIRAVFAAEDVPGASEELLDELALDVEDIATAVRTDGETRFLSEGLPESAVALGAVSMAVVYFQAHGEHGAIAL